MNQILIVIAPLFLAQPAFSQTAVSWTDAVGVTVTSNNLTRNSAPSGWSAGAASTQTIASGDGYVEFTASERNTLRMCGLSNGDSNETHQDIDFAIYLGGYPTGGILEIYEGGVFRGTFGSYATGDTLRVAVEGGVVRYSKNGALLHISTVAPTYPLLIDTSLYNGAATLNNVVISSGGGGSEGSFEDSPHLIFFDANGNTGFGTTSPIFNDDGVTGANVGKFFAIDGVTPGAAAYLGLGGHITNPTDRVGLLNFYNRAQAGLDGRTAFIGSFNDGALGRGNLIFGTSPDNVGPLTRMIIDSRGNIAMNRPHASVGTTLSIGGQTTNDTTYPLVGYNSQGLPVFFLTSGGKVGIGSVSAPKESLQVGPSAQFSVNSSGRLFIGAPGEGIILKSPNGLVCSKLTINDLGVLTTAIVTCPTP